MKKTLKKVGCTALALCTLAVGAVSFTACTTDRPEVEMQLSFNGKTYTLQYTLYRKYAPNTVNHFLTLAENEFYDGLCVHNYAVDSMMYTGAYTYDENVAENGGLVKRDYYAKAQAIGDKFPVSVWLDQNKQTPTYTLYGEFEENNYTIKNGSFLSQSFGALTMYYTKKTEGKDVYVQKVINGEVVSKDYAKNSATSQFSISLKTAAADKDYCTFATLNNTDVLQSLTTAVQDFANNYDADQGSFTVNQTIVVDEDDHFFGEAGLKETYETPEKPIVIEYVRVKKY